MIGILHALCPTGGPAPEERLAGLSLALRGALALQKLGAERILLLLDEDDGLAPAIASDARIQLSVATVVVRGSLSEALAPLVDDSFVVVCHDVVADPAIYRALLSARADDARGVAATREAVPVGPLFASADLLDEPADTLLSLARRPDVAALEVGARYAVEVRGEEGRRHAIRALFEACRKPVDGVISRHLNRHLSLFVSRQLVDTPITPNQMTAITFAVGVVAAWLASRGGYGATLGAAALMQLNSILDGCDGELARVRHQGSRLGEWLDTIGDDASNVLFWAGLGLGARSIEVYGGWLFLSGMVAAGANALAALVNYTELRRRGSGDLAALQPAPAAPPRGAAAWLVRGIGLILKQDFFLFLLLLVALAGYLHQALPAVALGALITLGAAIVRSVSGRRGDSPPARRADP